MLGGKNSGLGPGLLAGTAGALGASGAAGLAADTNGIAGLAGCAALPGGAVAAATGAAVAGECALAAGGGGTTASLAPLSIGTTGSRRSCTCRQAAAEALGSDAGHAHIKRSRAARTQQLLAAP